MSLKLIDNFEEKGFYLISDYHFFHNNVLGYCNRPFKNIEEMNKQLHQNWCDTISEDDICIFLGDFAFCGKAKAKEIWDSLPGRKYFIGGNHDKQHIKKNTYSELVTNDINTIVEISYQGYKILLNHFPPKFKKELPDGQLYMFGHIHNNREIKEKNCFNVSCEVIDYKPIHISEILAKIKEQNLKLSENYK